MTASVRRDDPFPDNLSVRHVVELELLRMSEMLKDFSVFIGDRDSHGILSFLRNLIRNLVFQRVAPAPDAKLPAVNKGFGDLAAGVFVRKPKKLPAIHS